MMRKKGLENLVFYTYLKAGLSPTIEMLDKMKELGLGYSGRLFVGDR
jgi:DNA-directed RNA polymerase subunit beta'